jgi:chondroitin AC lyase
VNWFWHAGVTTLFLQPAHLDIQAGAASGSWSSINTSGSKTPITENTFTPVLLHPHESAAAYILTAGTTLNDARSLAGHLPCQVIRNDQDIQAIRFADGMIMAAFYSPGALRLTQTQTISVDHPCLLLISTKATCVSDPSRQSQTITVQLNHTTHTVHLPADGTTVKLL